MDEVRDMEKTGLRRKAVQCVLCGKETRDPDRVCQQCRNAREAGIAYLSAPASEKPEQVVMDHTVNTTANNAVVSFRHAEETFSQALRQLIGAQAATYHAWGEGFKPATPIGDPDVRTAARYAIIPGVKGADVAELVDAVGALVVAAHRDGVKQGERFVTRLAAGEISFSELQNR